MIGLCPLCGSMVSTTGTGTERDPQIVPAHAQWKDGPVCLTESTTAAKVKAMATARENLRFITADDYRA